MPGLEGVEQDYDGELKKHFDKDIADAVVSSVKHFVRYQSCSSCKSKMNPEGSFFVVANVQ